MRAVFIGLLVLLVSNASADTLVVRYTGVETTYSGTIIEMNVDSPAGGIVFEGETVSIGPADPVSLIDTSNAFGDWTIDAAGDVTQQECAFFESSRFERVNKRRAIVSRIVVLHCR